MKREKKVGVGGGQCFLTNLLTPEIMQGIQILPDLKPSLNNLQHLDIKKHRTNRGLLEGRFVWGWVIG